MTKKKPAASINSITRRIEFHKAAILKHRDALRNLISDAKSVVESCDEACLSLEDAVDRLSEYL